MFTKSPIGNVCLTIVFSFFRIVRNVPLKTLTNIHGKARTLVQLRGKSTPMFQYIPMAMCVYVVFVCILFSLTYQTYKMYSSKEIVSIPLPGGTMYSVLISENTYVQNSLFFNKSWTYIKYNCDILLHSKNLIMCKYKNIICVNVVMLLSNENEKRQCQVFLDT